MPILKVQASSSLTCLFQAFRLLRHVASVFPPCVRGMSAADVQAYFKEVIDEMTAEHGKPPTAKQLASVTGLAVNEAADVLATLVPKEQPVKKRKRRQQPEDPAQEDPAQEESVKEPAPPSEVPETAEAEAPVDLGTPPLLPDNQLGDSSVYPTPDNTSESPEVKSTLRGTSQMCGPQFLVCFKMFSHMSPVFCNPRSLDMLMAAQRFHKGNSQTEITELDSSAEESLALDFALCMVSCTVHTGLQVYLVAHVFECHGGSCFFSTWHGGSCFFNMSWWFMVFQHVMVVHGFSTCHGGSCVSM